MTAMDFRQYDQALGRFNVMDALSEMAYDQTPYRYGFNNPVFWKDPSGLFETEKQAAKFLSDNGLNGSITYHDGMVENGQPINIVFLKTDGYLIWGVGDEDQGTKQKGNHKSIDATNMGNIGAGGFATKKNSLLGIMQYLSSAIGVNSKEDKNDMINENNDTIWFYTKNPVGVKIRAYKLKNDNK